MLLYCTHIIWKNTGSQCYKYSVADPGYYPGSECFLSPIHIFSIPDPHQRIKYFNPKNVSKLSEISSGLFIPDPYPDFFSPSQAPDPGSRGKKAPDPGSATLVINTTELRLIGASLQQLQVDTEEQHVPYLSLDKRH